MLRILYDDFDQEVKNIHDEMDLHHSYKKKACSKPHVGHPVDYLNWLFLIYWNNNRISIDFGYFPRIPLTNAYLL